MWQVLKLLFLLPSLCLAACPNNCNGQGVCDKYGRCQCSEGRLGADCSERLCPMGVAWSDHASGVDTAHNLAECSNRGICDRKHGVCECMEGITGAACERLECANECSHNGKCVTLKTKAEDTRDELSRSFVYDSVWDAHKIMGCVCDASHSGFDCSEWKCPNGDDPLTDNQVNEVQLLKCTATAGSFVLYFRGSPSATIASTAAPDDVRAALEHLQEITQVAVSYSQVGAAACQASPLNIISIEFKEQFGALPPLVAVMDEEMSLSGGSVVIAADGELCFSDEDGTEFKSRKGTKEADACAGRGLCDATSGVCECFSTNGDVYGSSNGYGAAGIRGDCGYPLVGPIESCPGALQCSGHGVCDETSLRCSCSDGWAGGDCSERTCPEGLSWFSYPTDDNTAHSTYAACSDMGLCDIDTGVCKCHSAFFGEACEYMSCGGGGDCSGHGRCLSMAELALRAEDNGDATQYTYGLDANNPHTWDAHRIMGCMCDTGFGGFDCSLRLCPRGDDPGTYNDTPETQLLQCIADGGTLSLTFRQQTTGSIAHNASAAVIEAALELLSTISDVTVELLNSTFACSTDGAGLILVRFDAVFGDVPPLQADLSLLRDDTNNNGNPGTGTVNVATDGATINNVTSVKGTTENDYCNNRGLCDFRTGECHCFTNWASSDGKGNIGDRGDCGYRNQFNTNGGRIPMDKAVKFQREKDAEGI